MVTVKIAGVEPDQVIAVSASNSSEAELGEATVELVDTSSNRSNFGPGDEMTIDWGNGVDWRGDVVGRPSQSDGRLTYRGLGEAIPLKHEQAFRVFYNVDSGTVVEQLATEETEQLPKQIVHSGDTPADWTSQAPIAEPYGGDRAGLYLFGTDLLVLGAREGHTGELRTTYGNVTSDAIVDGFFELETRLIFPQETSYWDLTVELKTPGGASYRWNPALQAGANTYVLAAEDADPEDSGLSTGELRYRLEPNGIVAQLTCLGIDHAATIPFETSSRSGAPNTDNVETTGREITRRVDGSVGSSIDAIATSDQANWYIDNSDLYYLPGGGTGTASLSIDSSTTIVEVDADRDYEGIRNVVTVQGANDIEVLRKDQASIDFYNGEYPRTEPLIDPQITSTDAAETRGDGFLADEAWNDALVTFSIADLSYAQLRAGDRVDVTWSDESLDGAYKIDEVEATSDGIVDVTIIASTARN